MSGEPGRRGFPDVRRWSGHGRMRLSPDAAGGAGGADRVPRRYAAVAHGPRSPRQARGTPRGRERATAREQSTTRPESTSVSVVARRSPPRRLPRWRERSWVRLPPRLDRQHVRVLSGSRGQEWRGVSADRPTNEGGGEPRSGVLAACVYARGLTGWQALPYSGFGALAPSCEQRAARAAERDRARPDHRSHAFGGRRPPQVGAPSNA